MVARRRSAAAKATPVCADGAAQKIEAVYEASKNRLRKPLGALNRHGSVTAGLVDVWAPTISDRCLAHGGQFGGRKIPENAFIHTTHLSGGSGAKRYADFVAGGGGNIHVLGYSVKPTRSREDDMQHDFVARISYAKLPE